MTEHTTGRKDGHLGYLLTAYLFDNLSAAGRKEVESHLAGCAQCRAELETLRRTLGAASKGLGGGGKEKEYVFDERRRQRVMEAAQRARQAGRILGMRRSVFWAAAGVAASFLAFIIIGAHSVMLPLCGDSAPPPCAKAASLNALAKALEEARIDFSASPSDRDYGSHAAPAAKPADAPAVKGREGLEDLIGVGGGASPGTGGGWGGGHGVDAKKTPTLAAVTKPVVPISGWETKPEPQRKAAAAKREESKADVKSPVAATASEMVPFSYDVLSSGNALDIPAKPSPAPPPAEKLPGRDFAYESAAKDAPIIVNSTTPARQAGRQGIAQTPAPDSSKLPEVLDQFPPRLSVNNFDGLIAGTPATIPAGTAESKLPQPAPAPGVSKPVSKPSELEGLGLTLATDGTIFGRPVTATASTQSKPAEPAPATRIAAAAGRIVLNGANTYSGKTTLSSSTLKLTEEPAPANAPIFAGEGTIVANNTLTLGQGGATPPLDRPGKDAKKAEVDRLAEDAGRTTSKSDARGQEQLKELAARAREAAENARSTDLRELLHNPEDDRQSSKPPPAPLGDANPDGPRLAKDASPAEIAQLKTDIERLRKEMGNGATATPRSSGDQALAGKYGPNTTVTTKSGKLTTHGLKQVWYYEPQRDSSGNQPVALQPPEKKADKDALVMHFIDAGVEPPQPEREKVAIASKDETIRRDEEQIANERAFKEQLANANAALADQNKQLVEKNAEIAFKTVVGTKALETKLDDLKKVIVKQQQALGAQDAQKALEIAVPPEVAANAQLGDHFETVNPDKPNAKSAFGNPEAHMLYSVHGKDEAGGGGRGANSLEDLIGVGGGAIPGTGGSVVGRAGSAKKATAPAKDDTTKWSMEEPQKGADVPLADLPAELEDIVGELIDKEEDMKNVEDVSTKWLDSMDKGVGREAKEKNAATTYKGFDTVTAGSWSGKYRSDGYYFVLDGKKAPATTINLNANAAVGILSFYGPNPNRLEPALRAYRYFRSENAQLTFRDFLRRPAPVPPPELTDLGLDEQLYIERYGTRPFVDCARENRSTFGMDVDTASYTLTRSRLRDGKLPEADAVRVEEFLNYFKQPYTVAGEDAFGVFAEGGPEPFGSAGVSPASGSAGVSPAFYEKHAGGTPALPVGGTPALPVSGTPALQLLKIGIKSREPRPDERKPAMLTIVVDTSGSMIRDDRLGMVRGALAGLVNELAPDDAVAIVGFSGQAELVLPRTQARQRQRILDAIETLEPHGATNVEAGLNLAYRVADECYAPDAVNRMILCSDGVANVGAKGPDEILKLVRVFAGRGIDLCTVGFGTDLYNDEMMRKLADNGNGSYHFVDSLQRAREIFSKQLPPHLNVLAKDAKVQVEFNPDVVARFRLLGYEKRKIANNDFRNDNIVAGEVAHSTLITVMYEILRKPGSHGQLGKVYLRWKDAGYRHLPVIERNYPLSEGLFAGDLPGVSPDLRFLACVARFAELLRGSPWVRDSSYAAVLEQLNRLPPDFKQREEWKEVQELVGKAQELSVKQWMAELR